MHCLPIRPLLIIEVYARFTKSDRSQLCNKLSEGKRAKLNVCTLTFKWMKER